MLQILAGIGGDSMCVLGAATTELSLLLPSLPPFQFPLPSPLPSILPLSLSSLSPTVFPFP